MEICKQLQFPPQQLKSIETIIEILFTFYDIRDEAHDWFAWGCVAEFGVTHSKNSGNVYVAWKQNPDLGAGNLLGEEDQKCLVKKKTVGDQHDKDLYKFLYYKDEKGIQEHDLGSSWVCVI